MKKIVWLCLALLFLGVGAFQMLSPRLGHVGSEVAGTVLSDDVIPILAQKEPLPQKGSIETSDPVVVVMDSAQDEEDPDLKMLRDQMNKERGIQQQIKLHNLELERTRVQLEQEKAIAEMNQLRKANLGIIRDPNGSGTLSLPDTKLVFLSQSEKAQQAILSINGTNFTVQQGDKPLENVQVKSISGKGVMLVVNGDKEVFLTLNLME